MHGNPKQADDNRITIVLDAEQLAAVRGWANANNMTSVSIAASELVRRGLLTEISEAFLRASRADILEAAD